MTTAHRPTWVSAKGSASARDTGRTGQIGIHDLPAHLTLKERQPGQGKEGELGDFKSELLEREREAYVKRKRAEREIGMSWLSDTRDVPVVSLSML